MELLRVFQRVWKQCLCLLLITVGLCVFQIQNNDDRKMYYYYDDMLKEYKRIEAEADTDSKHYEKIRSAVYRDVRKEIKTNPDRQEIEHAQQLFLEQVAYTYTYQENIANRIKQSENMLNYSLFMEDNSFYQLNVIKSANDMQKVQNSSVSLSNTAALEKLMTYQELPVLFLLVLLLFSAAFMEESNNGMQVIMKASKCGRIHLAAKRCGTLFLGAALMTLLVNGAVFAVYLYTYGGAGDLGNAVQSSQMFSLFPLPVSILQFFFLYCLLFAAGMYGLGVLIYAVMLLIRSEKFSYLVMIGIFAVEYFLYNKIAANSALCFLKYVNLFSVIMPGKAVRYENWGYDGFVTDVSTTALILLAVIGVVCTAAVLLIYSVQYGSRSSSLIKRIQEKLTEAFQRLFSKTNAFVMELYKTLILQRGWMILLLFCYLLSNCSISRGVDYSKDNLLLKEFYELYEGCAPNAEMEEYVKELQKEVDEFASIPELTGMQKSQLEDMKAAVSVMQDSILYISAISSEKNIKAVIVNPKAYNDVLGARLFANQENVNLVCILSVILAVGGIFSFERKNKMEVLCRTCADRKTVWYHKAIITVLLTFAIWGISCLFNWINICRFYDLKQLNAPLQSLLDYQTFPLKISILGYLVLNQLVRFILLLSVSSFVFGISVFFSYTGAIMVSLLPLIPHLLYIFKIPFMQYLSVVVSMDFNRGWLTYGGSIGKYALCFVVLAAGVLLCQRCFAKWNSQGGKVS